MTNTTDIRILTCLLVFSIQLASIFCYVTEENDKSTNQERGAKILPIFQVVKFPNDVCTGSTYNGTCYTAEECTSKGGTNQGSCASGFGVCCSFKLSCGGSSSENLTYIVQDSTTSITTNPCNYKICPCSSNICRIRYDFNTLTIAAAPTVTNAATASPALDVDGSWPYGQCLTDAFSIASPGAQGSPVICGTNSGYHMILDSDGTNCQNALFNIGSSTTSTRAWSIRVTQFTCGQEDEAGPPGCLQYYTATVGKFQNFGFPTSNTISTSTTHLANQHYDICVRRASGYCYICYMATIYTASAARSYGLGNNVADADEASTGTNCGYDWIEIPNAQTAANAAIVATSDIQGPAVINRFCGRQLNFEGIDDASITVCTKAKPFRVGVHLDAEEKCTIDNAIGCEWNLVAAADTTGGITGFQLTYVQNSC